MGKELHSPTGEVAGPSRKMALSSQGRRTLSYIHEYVAQTHRKETLPPLPPGSPRAHWLPLREPRHLTSCVPGLANGSEARAGPSLLQPA